MGVSKALGAPKKRIDDVGHRIPATAFHIREMFLKIPKAFRFIMVAGVVLVVVAICVLFTFVGIAANSGDGLPAGKGRAFLVKYAKPFHEDLLEPSSEKYQRERLIVERDVAKLVEDHLMSAGDDDIAVTLRGFRNGSTVAVISVESNTFESNNILEAVVAIADDSNATIGDFTVLGVEVTTIEIEEETSGEDSGGGPPDTTTVPTTTTTEPLTLPPRVPDPVHYSWVGDNMTWSAAKQFCESKGRQLCRSDEICVNDTPVLTGVLDGRRWTPTNDIANSWIQVGSDGSFVACWTYAYARSSFPSWGETTDNPEWKKDVYCCTAETHNITYCKQIERVFRVRSDYPHRLDHYFPGDTWQLPSGMWCRCATDGYSECHEPMSCFGGFTLGQIFCTGNGQTRAQQCEFPLEEGRQPPGKYVSLGTIKTYQAEECSECMKVGCKIWDTHWSGWGSWSSCSAPCGTGMRRRNKLCPIEGRCFGDTFDNGDCEDQPCTDQSVPPDEWSEQMLYGHNYFRRGHGSPLLTWDRALAATAQKYADYLRINNATDIVHSSQGWNEDGEVYRRHGVAEMMSYTKHGLTKEPPKQYMAGDRAAKGYYGEVRYYDWDNPGQKLKGYKGNYVVGHFTQLLWKSTKKMGCGVSRSDYPIADGYWVYVSVCHYEPGGNVAWTTKQWEDEVPTFIPELICQVKCGENKCYSFTGVHTNSTTASSCQCEDFTSPVCTSPCLAFCPGVEWNEMCYGENSCSCTYKAAVCDGLPIVD